MENKDFRKLALSYGKVLNKHFRANRPQNIHPEAYELVYNDDGKVVQVTGIGTGCRFDQQGSCMMCDYGVRDKMPTQEETKVAINTALDEVAIIIRKAKQEGKFGPEQRLVPQVLVFDCNGSVLDNHDFPRENLDVILKELKERDMTGCEITFETHYQSLDPDLLDHIKGMLPNDEINFELGFESSNPGVRESGLLKQINNDAFIKKVQEVNKRGMSASANIICGCPFLNRKEQKQDTLDSISFCLDNGVRNVILFPINNKAFTLLRGVYENGRETQPPIWLVCDVLMNMPKEQLGRVSVAWFGNRDWNYDESDAENKEQKNLSDMETIKPEGWEQVIDIITKYNQAEGNAARAKVVEELRDRCGALADYKEYEKEVQKLPEHEEKSVSERAKENYEEIAEGIGVDLKKEARKAAGMVEFGGQ